MTHLYLAPYVGTGVVGLAKGKFVQDPWRPRGSEQPGWAAIDLRPGGVGLSGFALMSVPVRDDTIGEYLGGDVTEKSFATKNALESKLGIVLQEIVTKQMLAELLLVHGKDDGTRWKNLRVHRDGMYRLWLGGKTPLWVGKTLSGGASAVDTFNRADANLDGSTSSDGQFTWSETQGTGWTIATNALWLPASSGICAARAQFDLASDDHYSQADVTGLNGILNAQVGPTCRHSTSAVTYYLHRVIVTGSLNEHALTKVIAGSFTDLGTDATDFAVGEILKCEADASSITAYRNGSVLIGPVTDTAITGNLRCGVWGNAEAGDAVTLDNFEAGDLAAAGLSIPVAMAQYRQRWN